LLIPFGAVLLRTLDYGLSRTVGYHLPGGELAFGTVLAVLFGGYTFVAQRRVYGIGRTAAAIRTLVLALTMIPMLVVFKFVLFFATLYWIS
jgi:hypothetical protein